LELWLTIFVGLTTAAFLAQLVVVIAIYVLGQRLGKQIESFMKDTREMMVPIKTVADNLRTASGNLVEIGLSAREQFRRVESMVTDTGEALAVQIERFDRVSQNVVDRINETTEIVQDSVVRPAREIAAIAKGLSHGLATFLFRKGRSTVDQARQDEELFI
jgi:hypothetical protein